MNTYQIGHYNIAEFTPDKFKIVYFDKDKRTIPYKSAFNCGFFAYYSEIINGRKVPFTLPVANIKCDNGGNVPDIAAHYIQEWTGNQGIKDGKVTMTCNQNGASQFHNKHVATLIVYENNDVDIIMCNTLPSDCKYAISGVPVIFGGSQVTLDYANKQGWGNDSMYSVQRCLLGIYGNTIYLISGKSKTGNYLASGEIFKDLKNKLPLESLISLDGGGSHMYKYNGKVIQATGGARAINNIGVIG